MWLATPTQARENQPCVTTLSSLIVMGLPSRPTRETQVQSLGREDFQEKEMATWSSILAWEIPWTEGPAGVQPMGLQELEVT